MKILIAADTFYPHVNGASYFAQRLAFYLQKRGHEVMVIAPSPTMRTKRYRWNGIPVLGIRSLSVFIADFRFSPPVFIKKSIEKAITEFRPDVIHVQSHFFICHEVIAAGKRAGIPLVGTNHFMPENLVHYLPVPEYLKQKISERGWRDFRKIYEPLDVVTAPTQTAADLTKRSNLKKEIHAISNGIDLERFSVRNDGEGLREKYRLPKVPILLYVGRLDKEKNVDAVLRALARVPSSVSVHFAIGGKGVEKERLEKLTQALHLEDRVTFLGFIPDEDLPGIYALADCFIIAGGAELQSIVTLEAMATGLPILALNAVALPELVHHGENGFLFDIRDTAGMAGHIQTVFSDTEMRRRMGEKSLEIVREHDIHRVMEKFEALYRGVMECGSVKHKITDSE